MSSKTTFYCTQCPLVLPSYELATEHYQATWHPLTWLPERAFRPTVPEGDRNG
jgi:hypothetical protein